MNQEKKFNKYQLRGSMHWQEMVSHDPRVFNAYQQARYDWVINLAGELNDKKVIDIGCGDGGLTYCLAKKGAIVTGIDNEAAGIQFARENLQSKSSDKKLIYEFVEASAYQLAFSDNSFDLAVSSEVIEHLQEPEKMLMEAARVLKPGGRFIVTTPYRLTEFPQDPNHVREYFPSEIITLFKKYFDQVEIKLTHHILWFSLYSYSVRFLGNRPIGRWLLNIPILLFGWNPFLFEYQKKNKFDRFTSIIVCGQKIRN